MTEQAVTEDVAQTLARYERLAIETGEWAGTDAPEFSRDGVVWLPVWVPASDGEVPPFVRATVYRAGAAKAVAVLAWAEHVPAQREVAVGEIDYYAKWMQNPMSLAGAAALRRAYQRAFRDVIGEVERSPLAPVVNAHAVREPAEPARDWTAELNAASSSLAELDRVYAATKGKGRLPEHEVLWVKLRRELTAGMAQGIAIAEAEDRRSYREAVANGWPIAEGAKPLPRPPAPNVAHLTDPVRKGRKS